MSLHQNVMAATTAVDQLASASAVPPADRARELARLSQRIDQHVRRLADQLQEAAQVVDRR
jgi:hypothetical protein